LITIVDFTLSEPSEVENISEKENISNIQFSSQPQNSIFQFPQIFTVSSKPADMENLMEINLLVFDFQDLQLQLLKMQITDFSGQLLSFNS
jgi:hypothetical protein